MSPKPAPRPAAPRPAPRPAAPAATGAAPPAAVAAVARYAFRACLPAKRRLGLLFPALGAVLFGLLAHAVDLDSPEERFAAVASAGIFSIVLPIGCLVIGDAVLGGDVRNGTLHFTWLSPIPRWTIVVGRWLAGTVVAATVLGAAAALAAVVGGVPDHAPAMVMSVVAGSAAYIAVFVALGAMARRAVVWSLAFVVLVERLLGAALDGIAQLSPGWLARAAYGGLTDSTDLLRSGVPSGGAALSRLVVVSAAALVLAAWRLNEMRLAGGRSE